uniref:Uncharacterized protein n=1 Tax=Rhizophora mucronata TaxID=61149 RepID=A0A2P2J3Z5_RHIMU
MRIVMGCDPFGWGYMDCRVSRSFHTIYVAECNLAISYLKVVFVIVEFASSI